MVFLYEKINGNEQRWMYQSMIINERDSALECALYPVVILTTDNVAKPFIQNQTPRNKRTRMIIVSQSIWHYSRDLRHSATCLICRNRVAASSWMQDRTRRNVHIGLQSRCKYTMQINGSIACAKYIPAGCRKLPNQNHGWRSSQSKNRPETKQKALDKHSGQDARMSKSSASSLISVS